ncbi:MAG: 3-oxoacyl-ACP reductase FabG [Pseudomonadota bacterium]|nr:3-oxoacyl-ACP reductase FabG [Pseudomonadota bacterium]
MDKKVALITGASRGIGAACARALSADGFSIALHYRRDRELADKICAELDAAVAFQADLKSSSACENLIKQVKAEYGRIDVLVNNAGMVKDQILPFVRLDDFEELLDVNLRSVFILSKFTSKQMIRQKSGRIINISSVIGHTGNSGQCAYAATKSAITGFTKSIAQDLAQFGIMCNCVAPGLIISEMTDRLAIDVKEKIKTQIPLKRFGNPSDVAAAVSFLASASYITGETIHVNGGVYS